ncbi:hypothetical protein OHR68_15235 [Spirillospora sp. NBC_00431]
MRAARLDPRSPFTQRLRLTLWCEESGAEHPVGPSYSFRGSREWFADVAPYPHIAARAIAVLAPAAGNASAVFAGEATDARRVSEFMKTMADASADLAQPAGRTDGSELSRSEGAALRRFRELLLSLDPERGFAGLRRVLSPTGDYLWVCPVRHPTYEPGLPEIPAPRP